MRTLTPTIERALAWALALFLAGGHFATGQAQEQGARPAISVAKIFLAEPGVAVPLPILPGPPGAIPRNSFVRVRGLPKAAHLSEGHIISSGSWAIPLVSLPNLLITAPVTASGKSEIEIALVGIDGAVLAEARSSLLVAPAALIAPPDAQAAAVPPQSPAAVASLGKQSTAPALVEPPRRAPTSQPPPTGSPPSGRLAPEVQPEERERALRQMRRGDEKMEEGSIAEARLFYKRAADGGLAEAAMALAATYDPAELLRRNVRGIEPNPADARRWYERANELGAPGAGERLRRLGAR